jgi:catechol 2,3-dioxygenase-like lactoylglutathione lyase family enzyme
MDAAPPTLAGIHLFVRDMDAALKFYALLGFTPARASPEFSHIDLPNGFWIDLGTYALTKGYDGGWTEPSGGGTNAIQLSLPSREAVDNLYAAITGAGHHGRLAPFDAFWGCRYAEVCDPDGNVLGFQSPRDETKVSPPPRL